MVEQNDPKSVESNDQGPINPVESTSPGNLDQSVIITPPPVETEANNKSGDERLKEARTLLESAPDISRGDYDNLFNQNSNAKTLREIRKKVQDDLRTMENLIAEVKVALPEASSVSNRRILSSAQRDLAEMESDAVFLRSQLSRVEKRMKETGADKPLAEDLLPTYAQEFFGEKDLTKLEAGQLRLIKWMLEKDLASEAMEQRIIELESQLYDQEAGETGFKPHGKRASSGREKSLKNSRSKVTEGDSLIYDEGAEIDFEDMDLGEDEAEREAQLEITSKKAEKILSPHRKGILGLLSRSFDSMRGKEGTIRHAMDVKKQEGREKIQEQDRTARRGFVDQTGFNIDSILYKDPTDFTEKDVFILHTLLEYLSEVPDDQIPEGYLVRSADKAVVNTNGETQRVTVGATDVREIARQALENMPSVKLPNDEAGKEDQEYCITQFRKLVSKDGVIPASVLSYLRRRIPKIERSFEERTVEEGLDNVRESTELSNEEFAVIDDLDTFLKPETALRTVSQGEMREALLFYAESLLSESEHQTFLERYPEFENFKAESDKRILDLISKIEQTIAATEKPEVKRYIQRRLPKLAELFPIDKAA